MTWRRGGVYRFATAAQWSVCLFDSAERSGDVLRPYAPYGGEPERLDTSGAAAPVTARPDEILWRDGAGRLHRLQDGASDPEVLAAPTALARAKRIVVAGGALWAAGAGRGSLECFDVETLTPQLGVDLAPQRVLDLASDGRAGLYVLLQRGRRQQVAHIDRSGRRGGSLELSGIGSAAQLAYLRAEHRVVVMTGNGTTLHYLTAADGAPAGSAKLNLPRPCFQASWLTSDGRSRVLVAGRDGDDAKRPHVLSFDAQGRPLGDLVLEAEATGLAASRKTLLVTTAGGLLRYSYGDSVPEEVAETRCALLTPRLESPAADRSRRWLRAQARIALPVGTTLEIAYASTDDVELAGEAQRIAGDPALTPAERLHKLRRRLENWTSVTLHGARETAAGGEDGVPLTAPLFEARERYLWLYAALTAGPGAPLPALSSLEVVYAAPTLMDDLPAIYRREEGTPGNFLRSLVGVLESTTQALDARIGAMGARADPATASPDWMDFTARWIGLPWNDALEAPIKRRILEHAAGITAARGTRRGLETLLECLLPTAADESRRYRVTDAASDFGFAVAGGAGCCGSALPAVLGGRSRAAAVTDHGILGRIRLPCGDDQQDAEPFTGVVRVDLAADAAQRSAWEPWLAGLLSAMAPATTRVRLRWISPALLHGDRLEDGRTLDDAPLPRLGTDAITGLARLPDDPFGSLPGSLAPGTRLH